MLVSKQEVGVSLSGSIEWEDFLAMMRPVVVQEYRKDAEDILADTSAAIREVTAVSHHAYPSASRYGKCRVVRGEPRRCSWRWYGWCW